jgi:hypothetical protein
MESIELKGVEQLDEHEKFELNKLVDSYKEKLKWKTKSDYVLKIVVKKYSLNKGDKNDAKAKYSFQGIIKGETQIFEASSNGWDFNKAVHQLFEKLMVEIEHSYHSSEQRNSGKNKGE